MCIRHHTISNFFNPCNGPGDSVITVPFQRSKLRLTQDEHLARVFTISKWNLDLSDFKRLLFALNLTRLSEQGQPQETGLCRMDIFPPVLELERRPVASLQAQPPAQAYP